MCFRSAVDCIPYKCQVLNITNFSFEKWPKMRIYVSEHSEGFLCFFFLSCFFYAFYKGDMLRQRHCSENRYYYTGLLYLFLYPMMLLFSLETQILTYYFIFLKKTYFKLKEIWSRVKHCNCASNESTIIELSKVAFREIDPDPKILILPLQYTWGRFH